MEEVAVTMETLTFPEFTETLYEGLTRIVNGTNELLAIVYEPGTKPGKKRATIFTMPSKVMCASYLFNDGSMKTGVWGSNSVATGNGLNMNTVFSTLTKNLARQDFPPEMPPSDSFFKMTPADLESIIVRSLFTLSPYGNSILLEDYLLMSLLFSEDITYFNPSFKKFILDYRYTLLPDKSGLVTHLSTRFQAILTSSSQNSFHSNSSTREGVYNETYLLFTMFLIIQRYVFNDLFIMKLDRTQELLIDIVKTSASPWQYIKDAIEVLSKQKEMQGEITPYSDYKISFRNHMLKYVVSYLESSQTQLLGEIKL